MTRESMEFDVVIVGAGPAGLATSIRLKQLAALNQIDLNVCIVEKAAEVGAHILSGAVIDPIALDELLPNWQQECAELLTPVTHDQFLFLTSKKSFRLPTPPQMQNHGNFIASLGSICRYLGQQAEKLGVEIFPGFAAAEIIFDEAGAVVGVITGDMGVNKDGSHSTNFQPGIELRAKNTIFAEGCRGSLTQQLIDRFGLNSDSDPQTYGIGVKELWEIQTKQFPVGSVIHTLGWPLDQKTYGGSFLYFAKNNLLMIGFVVGLDYRNPYLSPFEELQRLKLHPALRDIFTEGRRIGYGARALNEGGWQSIPELTFPGGLLIGDAAGFLNVPRIKGSHTAIKSGMLAAEAIVEQHRKSSNEIDYVARIKHSWIWDELYRARNIRPGFRQGLFAGLFNAAIDTYIFRGRAPWTLHNHADHSQLLPAKNCKPITYPKPDGKITFDRLSSVYLTNTYHAEEQPCHLVLKNPQVAITINYQQFAAPETRYCPAGVYEILMDQNNSPRLQINSQNCIHCKTCDIKDPTQNIVWNTPEGGGGPNYTEM